MESSNIMNDGERIDSLHIPGYSIIQNKNYFCYGIDAVLLAHYAVRKLYPVVESVEATTILDLCTGNAIVPILLCATHPDRNSCHPDLNKRHPELVSGSSGSPSPNNLNIKITALELQPQIADLARRSVKINNLDSQIKVVEGNLKDTESLFAPESFDMVTVNPPYMIPSKGRQSPNRIKMIARQELECTLEDVIKSASFVLKKNGSLVMIHRPDRLKEIYFLCEKYNLIIEEQINILPQKSAPATMTVILATRRHSELPACHSELDSESPSRISSLIIYNENHQYTEEVKKIYRTE